jgi:hypothetical protein
MENVQTPDPYDAVLADLRARKEHIENTITLLESLRAGGVPAPGTFPARQPAPAKHSPVPHTGPGAFFGMTVHDATRKLLASQRRQMQTTEIVTELERGGIVLTSADKINTVGSILLRRFNQVGDIVRVARGTWGLQEWYPGRKFPNSKNRTGDAEKGANAEQEGTSTGNEDGEVSVRPTAGTADWIDRIIDGPLDDPVEVPDAEPEDDEYEPDPDAYRDEPL